MAKHLQELADNNGKRFYSELKTIIFPAPTNVSPLRNEDDQLLTDKTEILDCWKRRFGSLLNRDTEVAATALNALSLHYRFSRTWMMRQDMKK